MADKSVQIFRKPREQETNFGFAVWNATPQMMPECHHHNDIEVNFMEKGSVTYLHGHQVITLQKGILGIFWAGRPHQVIERPASARMRGLTVPLSWFMNWDLPQQLIQPLLDGKMIYPPLDSATADFMRLSEIWLEDLLEDTTAHRKTMLMEIHAWFRRVGHALESLPENTVFQEPEGLRSNPEGLDKVEGMAKYIYQEFRNPITIPDIADSVALHPNYAVQLFHQKTGSTLVAFITQQRLAQAQMLLATTDTHVLDIAFESGFGSASRFYAAFRKAYNMTPRQYRQMIQHKRGLDGL